MPQEPNANKPLDTDNFGIACIEGIAMSDGGKVTVEDQSNIGELLNGGEHFNDFTKAQRKQMA